MEKTTAGFIDNENNCLLQNRDQILKKLKVETDSNWDMKKENMIKWNKREQTLTSFTGDTRDRNEWNTIQSVNLQFGWWMKTVLTGNTSD